MCQVRPPVELTVALDATLWDEPTTGIARYAHEVAGALAAPRCPGAPGGRAPLGRAPPPGEEPHPPHPRRAAAGAAAERGLALPRGGQRRPAAAAHPRHALRAHRARPHPPHLAGQRLPGVPLAVPSVARPEPPRRRPRGLRQRLDAPPAPGPSPRAGPGAGVGRAQRGGPCPARAARRGLAGLAPQSRACPSGGCSSPARSTPGRTSRWSSMRWSGWARPRPPWCSPGSAGTAPDPSSAASAFCARVGSTSAPSAFSPSRCSGP